MGASVSYKLKNSIQGALAGGGDPASSPLYVFGPFLSLIIAAGVGAVTFGASIWMAVFTVIVVSAMYRYVMIWVVDGSGGSGLCEEEFGSWAVKINATITVIEYTLTFLVSIAALVTFIVDRFPALSTSVWGVDLRGVVAVLFSLLVGLLVNRGPKISASFFGPATAAILVLLWVMIASVVYQRGLHLPNFDLNAFSGEYVHFTLGGYARILALMTGIEIFANLVAAYDGTAQERSRKAFGSLVIIMGTTVLTMVIVGPAILALADPTNSEMSVFTQTMDQLLPGPVAYLGSLVGIVVLLSAAAASAQGIQNLSLGLRNRHYIPAYWGRRNKFDVPGIPVWIQISVVVVSFFIFGTKEETYLALYAAGVFILLSMTGWATAKRLLRLWRTDRRKRHMLSLFLTVMASSLASVATVIIFEERFFEGAWLYFCIIPVFYFSFSLMRRRLGSPTCVQERLKMILVASPLSPVDDVLSDSVYDLKKVLVPLDTSYAAESSLASAVKFSVEYGAALTLLNVYKPGMANKNSKYLQTVSQQLISSGLSVEIKELPGDPHHEIVRYSNEADFDLIVMTTFGKTPVSRLISSTVTYNVIFETTPPLLLVRMVDDWRCRRSEFKKILVPLDGSSVAEQVLPYVKSLALRFQSEVLLLSVPEEDGNVELKKMLNSYLDDLVASLGSSGISVKKEVSGSGPSRTILAVANHEGSDLIVLSSHGRGGVERQDHVKLGSAVDYVICNAPCPIFFVSAVPIGEKHI